VKDAWSLVQEDAGSLEEKLGAGGCMELGGEARCRWMLGAWRRS